MKIRWSLGPAVVAFGLTISPLASTGAIAAPPSTETSSGGTTTVTTVVPLSRAQCDFVRSTRPNSSCQEIVTTSRGPAKVVASTMSSSAVVAASTSCSNVWQTRSDKDGGKTWRFRHEGTMCWNGSSAWVTYQKCFKEYGVFTSKQLQCDNRASGTSRVMTNRFEQNIKVSVFEPSATWTQTMTMTKNGAFSRWSN